LARFDRYRICSFISQRRNHKLGSLEVYAEAEPNYIFGGVSDFQAGFSNSNGVCLGKETSGFYDSSIKSLVFTTPLCGESEGSCSDNDHTAYCPDLFYPQQFGYFKKTAASKNMQMKMDIRSLTTALVNLLFTNQYSILSTYLLLPSIPHSLI
jgi:hypothetical protein